MAHDERLTSVGRVGLHFDICDSGPIDGAPVVLLHGFPQDHRSWGLVSALLHAQGYRTFAPDQRGYSPGARPRRRRDYRTSELVADTVALIDAIGPGPVHLVGHDWGAAVAWLVAAQRPDLLQSLTAVSVPHPQAFVTAMLTSTQGLKSWYMYVFQLPWLPERALTADTWARSLRSTGMPEPAVSRDAALMSDPDTARGGLQWYRALPFTQPNAVRTKITVPTLFVWSDGDSAVDRKGAELTRRYVSGPYTYLVLPGISHWIPEEAPNRLTEAMIRHFASVAQDPNN